MKEQHWTGRSNISIYQRDCLEAMKEMEDNAFDLAIVDPPYFKGVTNGSFYGSDISSTGVKRLSSTSNVWDSNIPNQEYFDELLRVSKNQIVWGVNYYPFFGMPFGRVIWDKKNDSSTFSNCEIASCSLIDSVKVFRQMWNGMIREGETEKRIHPTQKPVKLYEWLLMNYAKEGDKILDTHLGSGSHAIACWNLNFDLTAFELDADYFKATTRRIEKHTRQIQMF
jgi:site-specific DNA-methyltransferase (adenine-specific)